MHLLWVVFSAGPLVFSIASHAAEESAAGAAVTDADLARAKCVIGLERYIPADYFYCLASQSYGRQRVGDAIRFYREAAGWGSKPAEYVLGVMALYGDHQPANRPLALAWLTLAAERHTARFQKPYQELRQSLSASELKESATLLAGLGAYRDAIAMPRAEKRYREGMRSLHAMAMSSHVCLAGMYDFGDLAGGAAAITPDMVEGITSHCPAPAQLEEKINAVAAKVFEDWGGHVSVGPLQQVSNK